MNHPLKYIIAAVVAMQVMSGTVQAEEAELDANSIKEITKRVADWQIKTFPEHLKYRALSTRMQKALAKKKADPSFKMNGYVKRSTTENWHDLDWHNGALYAGMNQWRKIADDDTYTDWLKKIGERNQWQPHKRPYHADDHAVGHFYLSLYQETTEQKMI